MPLLNVLQESGFKNDLNFKLIYTILSLDLTRQFKDFKESQNFINSVGDIAETEGHHPDLYFGWGYAKVKIFTHAIQGLAEGDFILAAKIDQINQ